MNDSTFRLLPWEHGGVSPAPATEIEARVEGELRRFEIKWREGRAFFRLAGSDDPRVWASWDCAGENHIFPSIEAGEIGRYFVVERGFSTETVKAKFESTTREQRGTYDLFGPTCLAVVVSDARLGRAQEWCGGPWFDFALPPRAPILSDAHKPSIWHRGWNAAGLRGGLANLAGELAFRPFEPDAVADDGELTFSNGSLEQLRRLYQAAYLIFARDALEQQPWLRNYMSIAHFIRAETAQNRAWPHNDYVVSAPLLDAFIRHNLPVGGQWKRMHELESVVAPVSVWDRLRGRAVPSRPIISTRRLDFRFHPHNARLDFETSLDPSMHEQLEARLFLRDWMRDHLPPAELARLRKTLAA